MSKKFCVNIKGLSSKECKKFAIELDKFVSYQKIQFEERRNSGELK